MIIKIAEYKIRKENLVVVKEAVTVFVSAIRGSEPNTFYEAFQRKDTLEFIHLMKFLDAEAEKKHANAPYTHEFVKVLYPKCEKEPKFTDLSSI